MLQDIRSNLQGTIAKVIVGIICIPFVLFGVESLIGGGSSNHVAEVNGDNITAQELNEAIFLQKRQLLANMGENFDPAMLEEDRLKEPALKSLIDRKVILQAAESMGMTVSPQIMNRQLVNNPEFQENGQFSQERFQQALAGAGFNAELFTRLYGTDLLMGQFSGGILDSDFVTNDELSVSAQFTQQTRDVRFITLSSDDIKKSLKPSDEELQSFYDANHDLFQSKEQLSVQYIELEKSRFFEEVNDVELLEAFENEQAQRNTEDQREVSHILIEVNDNRDQTAASALANDIAQKAANGQDFKALAAEYSDDFGSRDMGGNLGLLNTEAFPEAFVNAAMNLDKGAVSEAVETEAGFHIIKVNDIVVADTVSFEDRKPSLAKELQLAKAEPLFWQAVDELKDISFNSADLQDSADALELTVKTSPLFTRSGAADLFANPLVISAAFSNPVLTDGQNSDVIEISNEHVVVIRLAEYQAASLLEFESVKADVTRAVVNDQADKLLAADAEKLVMALQQGGDVETIAKTSKNTWQILLATTRNNPKVTSERAVLNHAFTLPSVSEGERAIDSLRLANGDVAILAVDNIQQGSVDSLNDAEKQGITQYMGRAKASELFQAWQQALQEQADIDIL